MTHERALAMVLHAAHEELAPESVALRPLGPDDVLLQVGACAACRTDLHVIDGELEHPKLPLVLGHEIVGTVIDRGPAVDTLDVGERVGVPWLGWTCGACRFCTTGRENLCERARFTGYDLDGGYATMAVADARFCFPIPDSHDDVAAAPLLCAGLIGHRTLRLAGDPARLGIYGFGAAAHIVTQIARHEGREVYAFTRPGDVTAQDFARSLGASWAGGSDDAPPEPLDAALVFAPDGALVPTALRALDRGGTVVCGGIHMSDIPSFAYADLWQERVIRSVANLTRRDGDEFLRLAAAVPVHTTTTEFPLTAANEAVAALRQGALSGAAVLVPDHGFSERSTTATVVERDKNPSERR